LFDSFKNKYSCAPNTGSVFNCSDREPIHLLFLYLKLDSIYEQYHARENEKMIYYSIRGIW